jgi:hypothetical protein
VLFPPVRQLIAPSRCAFAVLAIALGAAPLGCQGMSGSRASRSAAPDAAKLAEVEVPAVAAPPPVVFVPGDEVELFDGSTLGMWKPESTGPGDSVVVDDGAIQLRWGNPGTSVAWTGARVPANYELSLEVQRIEGSGSGYWFLTFPIGDDRTCTLTLANRLGWLCGASGPVGDGAFTREVGLDTGRWHAVRLRVIHGRVEAFFDGEELVVEPSAVAPTELSEGPSSPSLEIATWAMTAAVRDIRLKPLPDRAG